MFRIDLSCIIGYGWRSTMSIYEGIPKRKRESRAQHEMRFNTEMVMSGV